ncbi:MAG: TRAP transporter large permease subunit [Thermodesulfobacteriota bacterium]
MFESLITLAVFLLLLIVGVPIAFSFFVSGIIGIALLRSLESGLSVAALSVYSESSNYILLSIPLFVLMGQFIFFSGLSKDLYEAAYRWLGRMRGGLAHATIATCIVFAACTGSSMASVGTIAPIAMAEMERYKYDVRLACGAIASGGTLGILIPPSLAFIVYGYICKVPIGPLFIAGILPGILLGFMLMFTVFIKCARHPELGPPGPPSTFAEKWTSLKKVYWPAVILITIMGGIYFGIVTPTEAAALGSAVVFFLLIVTRKMTKGVLFDALRDTIRITVMIFTVFIGAKIFNTFLGLSGIPQIAVDFLTKLPVSPFMVVLLILIAYIPLGCFVDSMPLALLTLPIVFPVIEHFGFDPLWFGVLHVVTGEISLITPPVGMNVYILSGVTGKSLEEAFRGTVPFLVAMIGTMFILFLFPSISTILPYTMQ